MLLTVQSIRESRGNCWLLFLGPDHYWLIRCFRDRDHLVLFEVKVMEVPKTDETECKVALYSDAGISPSLFFFPS